jgi:hypothetical protein
MKLATRQATKVCTLALVQLKRRFIGDNSGRDLFVRKGTFDHYHHCSLPASVLPSGSTAATPLAGSEVRFPLRATAHIFCNKGVSIINAGDQKQFHAGDQKQLQRAELCAASVAGWHLCAAPSFPFDGLYRIQAKAVVAVLRPVQCPD